VKDSGGTIHILPAEYALVTHPCGKLWRGAQINHSGRALSTADAA
jgi:hypothetical protein